MQLHSNKKKFNSGMSLVEVLVGTAVFLIIAVSVYESYVGLFNLVRLSRVKVTASNLANEQFEIAKNLPYSSVGLVSGVPSGVLQRFQDITRDGITFRVTTTIRNIDDSFDGTAGGAPNDLSPADYKLMEVQIDCSSCKNYTPLVFTGKISPKSLESNSSNGSLFVRAIDSAGNPIMNAQVSVVNTPLSINISEETDSNGMLQIVDAPPSVNNYQITVTKSGYSTEQTYPLGGSGLENPSNPHATVIIQNVTQKSFSIDRTGTINLSTVTESCTPVSNISFNIKGSKTLGTNSSGNPVLKYDNTFTTNGSGLKTLSALEWDTYSIALSDASYVLRGTISPLPVNLAPNSSQNVTLTVNAKDPDALMVTIKDAATGLPVTDATVTIEDSGGSEQSLTTGRGFLSQSDWSGGGGQESFTEGQFSNSDGNIDYSVLPGALRLKEFFSAFVTNGELTSSTFDTGSASNFYQLLWNPTTQPVDIGTPNIRFQIATNNDQTTWNYKGPDGTSGTYYTIGNQNIHSSNNGNRYLRYKLFMDSAVNYNTPSVSDVSFTFTSACVPPGQVLFKHLGSGNYSVSVAKSGYQTYSGTANVNTGWQNFDVSLQPE